MEDSLAMADRDHKRMNRMHADKLAALLRIEFNGDEQSGDICAICWVEYKKGEMQVWLACDHRYHDECGSKWLKKGDGTCPVCRHK